MKLFAVMMGMYSFLYWAIMAVTVNAVPAIAEHFWTVMVPLYVIFVVPQFVLAVFSGGR